MDDFRRPAEDFAEKTRDYVDARVDDVKLRLVRGLSISVSKLLGLILLLGVVSAFLLVASFGILLLLAEWTGLSYGLAAIIVAAILLIICILMFIFRDKMFQGGFVRLFAKLFFGGDEDEQ